jgi:hypothetical protein
MRDEGRCARFPVKAPIEVRSAPAWLDRLEGDGETGALVDRRPDDADAAFSEQGLQAVTVRDQAPFDDRRGVPHGRTLT